MHRKRPKLRWETLVAILTHLLTFLSSTLPFVQDPYFNLAWDVREKSYSSAY